MVDDTPSGRAQEFVTAHGIGRFVSGCVAILRTGSWADRDLLLVLGGQHAARELTRTVPAKTDQSYWAPTWAARGLLHAWDDGRADEVAGAVEVALTHEHWRVREMAAKVAGGQGLGQSADALARLVSDPVPRVRIAIARALGKVGEVEHATALHDLDEHEEPGVRAAARTGLRLMADRLDREV